MIVNGQKVLFAPAGTKVKVDGVTQGEWNADTKADKTEMNELLEQKQDKLTAGGGSSINNNVISSLLKGAMCLQTNSDQAISSSSKAITFGKQVSSIGTGVSHSNGNFTIGEGITCIKFTICCNFYNMEGCSYYQVDPKKNNAATGDSLWFFFDSGHSGGFTQTIMLPCKNGDVFRLDGKTAGYSGYLNGNSYVTVEVF